MPLLVHLSAPEFTLFAQITACVKDSVGDQNLLKSCVKDFQDSLSLGSKKTLLGK